MQVAISTAIGRQMHEEASTYQLWWARNDAGNTDWTRAVDTSLCVWVQLQLQLQLQCIADGQQCALAAATLQARLPLI